jgi:hypothetical protein
MQYDPDDVIVDGQGALPFGTATGAFVIGTHQPASDA